jgi:protein PsiE
MATIFKKISTISKGRLVLKNLIKNLQLGLLIIILVSTIIAVFIEIINMYDAKSVTLADLLLMFLYLEVMAMVRVFWDEQSIRITLPLLIAITALSRFIILQGKEMDPTALVYESVAILLIAIAIVVMRLRHSKKLGIETKGKKK